MFSDNHFLEISQFCSLLLVSFYQKLCWQNRCNPKSDYGHRVVYNNNNIIMHSLLFMLIAVNKLLASCREVHCNFVGECLQPNEPYT